MKSDPAAGPVLPSRPRARRWLQGALVISLVGPVLLLALVGWVTYREALETARARLSRLAQIAQEHSQRVLETNEVISRGIVTRIGTRSSDELRASGVELHEVLKAWTQGLRQLQSVWIWDETGRPVATNLRPDPPATLNVSDRAYFIWARRPESNGWYVSSPLRSRLTGELFFDYVRRRSAADGSFQGAISISLRPAYFDAFFGEQLRTEPGTTLSLIRADGTVLSRFPALPAAATASRLSASSPLLPIMAADSPGGEVEGVSTLDGQYRLGAYRRVSELPLYAVATGSRDAVLGPWRRSMTVLAAFTLPLALGLAALCWFALRRVHSEHAIALEHRRQYEQLLKTEEALRLAQKMEALGRLTGGVAHDFNNLLMVVQSSVSLARQLQARGMPLDKALAPIERAVANGAQLTRQLLAVVRRQPLQVRTVELAELVGSLAQLMSSTLGHDTEVTHDVAAGLHVTVDRAELELALINLCINARDAMPDGGPIRIEARGVEPPPGAAPGAGWLSLSVADTGEGIPPELLGRVTEPFFTTKPLGKGTGLGLSQVQAFVVQSAGRLQIDSRRGHGTRVALLLPAAAPPEPAGVAESAASTAGALQPLAADVLLVEDNRDIAAAVAAVLQGAGARVTWHATADAAWAALRGGARFHVVLSDVSLPGERSGIDLARELSAAAPPVPVVLMTGYTDRLQEATAAGFRVVPKPATPERLLDALVQATVQRG